MTGIYAIVNILTNTRYIGQSVHVETRKREHFNALRSGVHFNPHLQNAFNYYGENNFIFEVLEECTESALSDREVYWMEEYGGQDSNLLYNIAAGGRNTSGANNPNYGKHWSEAWKTEQSQKMKKFFSNPDNHPMYGKHHSDESKQKIAASLKGRHQSEEANRKRSQTLKKRYAEGLVPSRLGKPLKQSTKDLLRAKSSQRRHTEDQKRKISEKVSGANNGMYGKHLTDAQKQHLSETHKGCKNHMFGKIRITDGVINRTWPKDTPIPEGFRPGMAPRKQK